ncbi:hypothetical protein QQX09_01450 [Demequina sp. SYSU T00192]|uniref:AbiEi antitoxin C-terminal domain-containing protein n=1 Tax=Demequina litoralis TaxID=3051660 RepID=A0ABT8G5V5_9MICO|nr:hypothetical protein [Demequina sp. SYSU T00192]MDN4474516.1 hypothetical protein [Demequina sp. SYSU T00192]
MILLRAADVGRPAFARLARQRIVAPHGPGVARPLDVPDSPGLRALAASPRVPAHVVLTGTAALWVHGWVDDAPVAWHAVGHRGLYRPPHAEVALHSGVTARMGVRVEGGLMLAPPARACVDALRWEEPAVALAAVCGALAAGRIGPPDLEAALAHDAITGGGYARLASLVDEVSRAASRP